MTCTDHREYLSSVLSVRTTNSDSGSCGFIDDIAPVVDNPFAFGVEESSNRNFNTGNMIKRGIEVDPN